MGLRVKTCHGRAPAPRLLSLALPPDQTGPREGQRAQNGAVGSAAMHVTTPRAWSPVPLSPRRPRPRLSVEGGSQGVEGESSPPAGNSLSGRIRREKLRLEVPNTLARVFKELYLKKKN